MLGDEAAQALDRLGPRLELAAQQHRLLPVGTQRHGALGLAQRARRVLRAMRGDGAGEVGLGDADIGRGDLLDDAQHLALVGQARQQHG